MQSSTPKPVIYQMMTRLFGNKISENKLYGTIEENGVGKFNDINTAALQGVRELGVTHIWYTGVIEHALLTDYTAHGIPLDDADVVKGRAGSPYAIKDYYDVNPDLATNVPDRMKEFEQLVQRTHDHGMKVIIDFVPNHVARQYASDARPPGVRDLGEGDDKSVAFSPANNFYYLPGQPFRPPRNYSPLGNLPHPTKDGKFEEEPAKATGNDQFTASPGIHEWFETVKLNYGVDIQHNRQAFFEPVPPTWHQMHDILAYWIGKNVDGFRCDMAEMVPVEFWRWLIPRLKDINPDIVFIAEIYNPAQYRNYIDEGKFDFLYDKVLLYDTLRLLTAGHRSTTDIHDIQTSLNGINHRMLHFMENHDEQRLASTFFAGDGWSGLPAMVVSATIDAGPVMIYFGQEVGEPGKGSGGFQQEDGRTTIFDYWGVPEHQKWMNGGAFDGGLLSADQKELRSFYANLLKLASTSAALSSGKYVDLTAGNVKEGNMSSRVHAFLRYHGDERLLVVTSFSAEEQQVHIRIPADVIAAMGLGPVPFTGSDVLTGAVSIESKEDFTLSLAMKPRGSYIFKLANKPTIP